MNLEAVAKLAARLAVLEEEAAGCLVELEEIVGLPLRSAMSHKIEGRKIRPDIPMKVDLSPAAMDVIRQEGIGDGEVRRFKMTDTGSPDNDVYGECHVEGGVLIIDKLDMTEAVEVE